MNIYVLTENNYLFSGIEHTLAQKLDCRCIQLIPECRSNHIIYERSNPKDVFLIAAEYSKFNFSTLVVLNETNAAIIVASDFYDAALSDFFRFSTISGRFCQNELLKGIYLIKPTRSKVLKLPKMTSAEKAVLLLILKGATMSFIGSRLNIATKTAYTHQRSAFKKLGIRKCQDMLKLPDNYINYLCGVR